MDKGLAARTEEFIWKAFGKLVLCEKNEKMKKKCEKKKKQIFQLKTNKIAL
jgi:hypothetical protein